MADAATSSWVDWAPCLEKEVILSTGIHAVPILSFALGLRNPQISRLQVTKLTHREGEGFSEERSQPEVKPARHTPAQPQAFLQRTGHNQGPFFPYMCPVGAHLAHPRLRSHETRGSEIQAQDAETWPGHSPGWQGRSERSKCDMRALAGKDSSQFSLTWVYAARSAWMVPKRPVVTALSGEVWEGGGFLSTFPQTV